MDKFKTPYAKESRRDWFHLLLSPSLSSPDLLAPSRGVQILPYFLGGAFTACMDFNPTFLSDIIWISFFLLPFDLPEHACKISSWGHSLNLYYSSAVGLLLWKACHSDPAAASFPFLEASPFRRANKMRSKESGLGPCHGPITAHCVRLTGNPPLRDLLPYPQTICTFLIFFFKFK